MRDRPRDTAYGTDGANLKLSVRCNPSQKCGLMVGGTITIFHRIKRTKDGSKVPIANPFSIPQGIFIKPTFPEPLPMMVSRVRKVLHI